MKKLLAVLMAMVLCLSAAASVSAHPHHHDDDDKDSVREQLKESRKALEKYRDIKLAQKHGYVVGLDPKACVPKMGIHLINPKLVNDSKLHIKKPEILVYEPQKNGKYKLVAAEWYVPKEFTKKTPRLFNQKFDGPMANHDGSKGEHYDLHVWFFKKNPDGMFEAENERVSCKYAK